MNRRYTFEEVFDLDDALYKLALYEVNEGKMRIMTSHEELMDVHLECAEKFNYFKDLIQSGECTMDYLKNTVLFKNGPYHQYDPIDTPEKLVDRLDKLDDDTRGITEGDDVSLFCDRIGDIIQEMTRSYEAQEVIGEELEITDTTTTPKKKAKEPKRRDKNGNKD